MTLARANLVIAKGCGFASVAGFCLFAGFANAAGGPLAVGQVDSTSPVAAEVTAAEHAPGPYPRFSKLPPMPTDLRPVLAWRTAVRDEWAQKRQVEQAAAAIPFTLNNSETWAEDARGRISPALSRPAPADTASQTEAFAAAERARATPPPSSK